MQTLQSFQGTFSRSRVPHLEFLNPLIDPPPYLVSPLGLLPFLNPRPLRLSRLSQLIWFR